MGDETAAVELSFILLLVCGSILDIYEYDRVVWEGQEVRAGARF
jgi:hypothetical protein